MFQKKAVFRTCCVCRKNLNRDELIKITVDFKTKDIVLNPDNFTFGRSAYVCHRKECTDKILKKNLIFNRLKIKATDDNIEKIRSLFS